MGDMEEDSRRAVRHCWTSKDADSKHSAPELPRTFPDASGSKATSIENQNSQHRHTSFYCTSPYQDLQLLSLGGLFLLAFFPPTTWRFVATLPWASLIVKVMVAESCLTLCNHTDCCPPGFPVHSPDKNTRVGCHCLLRGILPIQGSNPRSPPLQVDSLPSEPPGKPLEQVYQHLFPICEFIYPLEQPHKEVISWFTADIFEVHLRGGMWLLQGHAASSCQWSNSNPQLWIPDATHHPSLDSSFWVEDGQVQKTMS